MAEMIAVTVHQIGHQKGGTTNTTGIAMSIDAKSAKVTTAVSSSLVASAVRSSVNARIELNHGPRPVVLYVAETKAALLTASNA